MNTNTVENVTFREGDIFFWRYKETMLDSPYWCKSRIAVVKGKRLYDTFWSLSADSTQWDFDSAKEHLILEYQGNFNDLEPMDSWLADYYDVSDVVNLNHSNSSKGNYYRRKGAKRSKERVLDLLARERGKAEDDIRSANWKLENLAKTELRIMAGEDLEIIYL